MRNRCDSNNRIFVVKRPFVFVKPTRIFHLAQSLCQRNEVHDGPQPEQGVTIILPTATDVLSNSPLSVDFIRRFQPVRRSRFLSQTMSSVKRNLTVSDNKSQPILLNSYISASVKARLCLLLPSGPLRS